MKLLLLLTLACASVATRCDSQIVTDTTPILGIVKPALADSAWRYVQRCSRLTPRDSFPLSRVNWFVADLIAHSKNHDLIGLWQPPDTIILDLRFANDFQTISHELTHYLRQIGGHPDDPFKKCNLGM